MRLNKQFYCKKSKASKKTGLAPIEVAVNVGGERSYITLELRAKPEQFVKDIAFPFALSTMFKYPVLLSFWERIPISPLLPR